MKKTKGWKILLMLLIAGCGVWLIIKISTNQGWLSRGLTVEFVSAPQHGFWRYHSSRYNVPSIAVGDLTGDHYPEIVFSVATDMSSNDSAAHPEDYFYMHPLVFSWTGETFELLDTEWVGITSYTPQVSVHDAQAVPFTLLIIDLDADGVNEILIGTTPYSGGTNKGALYIFQWDGKRFVAEYSDYCMGRVSRLDYINDEKLITVSSSGRPTGRQPYDRYICPEVVMGEDELRYSLYALRSVQANKYEAWPLILDNNFDITTLTTGYFTTTQFIRGQMRDSSDMIDWNTTHTWRYAGEMLTDTAGIIVENPIVQAKAADLDGDGVMELVVLAAYEWKPYSYTEREDNLTWLVFQKRGVDYHKIYEADIEFASSRGQSYSRLFTVGDVDSDGADEVLAGNGELYKWHNGRLVLQMNLMTELGQEFCRGIESAYIGRVHADSKNRIVFTAHVLPEEGFCSDTVHPQVYIVKINQEGD